MGKQSQGTVLGRYTEARKEVSTARNMTTIGRGYSSSQSAGEESVAQQPTLEERGAQQLILEEIAAQQPGLENTGAQQHAHIVQQQHANIDQQHASEPQRVNRRWAYDKFEESYNQEQLHGNSAHPGTVRGECTGRTSEANDDVLVTNTLVSKQGMHPEHCGQALADPISAETLTPSTVGT